MNLLEDFSNALPQSLKVIKHLFETDTDFVDKLQILKQQDPKAYQLCVVGNVTTNMANDDYIRTIKQSKYPTWMCWM